MGEIAKSEAFVKLSELFGQYKRFCFDIASKLPYASVPAWVAFSDNRVEDALGERRGVWQSIKDSYVLYALGSIFALIAFWWVAVLLGGMLLLGLVLIAVVSALANPGMMALVLVIALAAAVIGPAGYTLLRAAFYHLITKFFGGKGSYADTLAVLVMTCASSLLLMIPLYLSYAVFIGYIISPLAYVIIIYAIYLQYRGMKHVHSLPAKEAAVATAVALVLEFLFWAALYMVFQFGMLVSMLGK
jgi:hypothetical protein